MSKKTKKILSEVARAAQQIRQLLKNEHPDCKFKVISENFSGGNAVNVYYEDYKRVEEIQKLIGHFKYGQFDPMTDLYENTNVRKDIPQTKYLFINRKMSDQTKEKLENKVRSTYMLAEDLNYNEIIPELGRSLRDLVYKLFCEQDIEVEDDKM